VTEPVFTSERAEVSGCVNIPSHKTSEAAGARRRVSYPSTPDADARSAAFVHASERDHDADRSEEVFDVDHSGLPNQN
jgi:hypothetical protein